MLDAKNYPKCFTNINSFNPPITPSGGKFIPFYETG